MSSYVPTPPLTLNPGVRQTSWAAMVTQTDPDWGRKNFNPIVYEFTSPTIGYTYAWGSALRVDVITPAVCFSAEAPGRG